MFAVGFGKPKFSKSSNSDWEVHYENSNRISLDQSETLYQSDFSTIGSIIQRRKGHASWKINLDTEAIFVKQYYARNFLNRLTYLFRSNRARKEYETHCRLSDFRFPIAELYFFGEQTGFKLWKQSCLAFRLYESYEKLSEIENCSNDISLSRDLAKLIARLHNCGVYYGDLHGEMFSFGEPTNVGSFYSLIWIKCVFIKLFPMPLVLMILLD